MKRFLVSALDTGGTHRKSLSSFGTHCLRKVLKTIVEVQRERLEGSKGAKGALPVSKK